MWVQTLPLILLVPVLLYAGYSDLRWLRIPNRLSLVVAALFIGVALTLPMGELFSRVVISAAVFTIGVGLFALGLVGAGDVKLLSVVLLFVPSTLLLAFAQIFSVALLVGTAFIVMGRKSHALDHLGWKSIDTPGVLPMGISIAMAGIAMAGLTLIG